MTAEGLVPHYARVGADPVRDAFAARRAVMPWRSRRPLPAGEVEATWARLLADRRAAGPRLAYVHVPFCANHCLFCGFYRNAYTPQAATAYTDLVIAEIEREADAPAVAAQPVEAVYLGGGTPSALSADEVEEVVRNIGAILTDGDVRVAALHFVDPERFGSSPTISDLQGPTGIRIVAENASVAIRARSGDPILDYAEDVIPFHAEGEIEEALERAGYTSANADGMASALSTMLGTPVLKAGSVLRLGIEARLGESRIVRASV